MSLDPKTSIYAPTVELTDSLPPTMHKFPPKEHPSRDQKGEVEDSLHPKVHGILPQNTHLCFEQLD